MAQGEPMNRPRYLFSERIDRYMDRVGIVVVVLALAYLAASVLRAAL